MTGSEYVKGLYRLFRDGPSSGDGTLVWLLGMMIWWRMVAQHLLIGASLTAVMWIGYWIGEPVMSAVVALFIGIFVGGWTKNLSPKYNVTKNY